MRPLDPSRRDFLAAGTGLLVFSHAAPLDAQQPATGAWSCSAAISSKTALASAAARRSTKLNICMHVDPPVPESHGQSSVSPINMSTESYATSSSSARHCASAVISPWPMSTFPTRQSTRPSAPMRR